MNTHYNKYQSSRKTDMVRILYVVATSKSNILELELDSLRVRVAMVIECSA